MKKLTEADFQDNFANDHISGFGEVIDVYALPEDKIISENQLVVYNVFKSEHLKFVSSIEEYINKSLTSSELKKIDEIRKAILHFDIILIAEEDSKKYDLVLVCGKDYKKFFRKKSIDVRVEFLGGEIQSIQRKKNTTQEN